MNYKELITRIFLGLIGGGILIFLSADPFKLYYLGGYLIILTLILLVYIGIRLYRKSTAEDTTYWERVCVGAMTYSIAILSLTTYLIFTSQMSLIKDDITDFLLVFLIHVGFGLTLSLLFSIRQRNTSVG
jgi:hypothetical protein